MKTFLWTTLFWIIIVIAGLLCLWFGNLWTQVLENEWMTSFLPNNLKNKVCEPVIATALDDVNWCEKAQDADCNLVTAVETWDLQGIQESINAMLSWQAKMYEYMNESFTQLNEKVARVNSVDESNSEDQSLAAKEQKKKELQEQLSTAIAELRFEDAAAIRDQIKALE